MISIAGGVRFHTYTCIIFQSPVGEARFPTHVAIPDFTAVELVQCLGQC